MICNKAMETNADKSLDIKLHNDYGIDFIYRKWQEIVIYKE